MIRTDRYIYRINKLCYVQGKSVSKQMQYKRESLAFNFHMQKEIVIDLIVLTSKRFYKLN